MIVKKITVGFVVQSYDTEAKKFTEQNFTAGDQVDWEDEFGEPLVECSTKEYLPFDMVQPQ
jgi:phosphoribosylaminoimidazole-succinocarboxamide synthase